ncbi:MAG: DUF1329 domain-containing protein [Halieaceae bacterium]|nr:DUF1329 domain-containing protein [Halieaceae bacterium]MCP5202912.1 DUF1329 domain-containing protein [Pseudomonadales bacterium]
MMSLKLTGALVAGIALGWVCAGASAAVSEQELEQLGTTLTPWGAVIAGLPDGEYPPYEGGIKEPPAGFDPSSGMWPDPYPEDKPLFSIDASNMEQYKDQLMEAQMELMRRYPSFRMDIYPTRRSIMIPKYAADHSLENARNPQCRTSTDGVGLYGCWGGTPFPIPGNGYEAMWNHLLTYTSPGETVSSGYLVDANGATTLLLVSKSIADYPYYNPQQAPYEGAGIYYLRTLTTSVEPAREAGTQTLLWYPLRYDMDEQRAWSYQPGLRRVRLAPEFAYDTPVAQFGGAMFFDEINLFAGRMDRFNFELKGRKLMYMPYNNYRMHQLRGDPSQLLGAEHFNPDKVRYELRRVWVVEATPLPEVRHMAAKKRFYLDEDSWIALAYEGWDHSNKLFRLLLSNSAANYYTGGILQGASIQVYDLSRGQYAALQVLLDSACYIRYGLPQQPDSEMAPARMGSRGIR